MLKTKVKTNSLIAPKTKFSAAEIKAQRMAENAIKVRDRAEFAKAMRNPLYRARIEYENDGQAPFIYVRLESGQQLLFKIFGVRNVLPESRVAFGTIKKYGEVIEGRVVLTDDQIMSRQGAELPLFVASAIDAGGFTHVYD